MSSETNLLTLDAFLEMHEYFETVTNNLTLPNNKTFKDVCFSYIVEKSVEDLVLEKLGKSTSNRGANQSN